MIISLSLSVDHELVFDLDLRGALPCRVDGQYQTAMTWVTKDGRFEFIGLPPGVWQVRAYPIGLPLEWVRTEVELPASGRLEGVDIALPAKKGE